MRHPIPIAAMTANFAGVSLSQVVHAPYAHARDAIDQKANTFKNDMFTRRPGDKAQACFMRRYDAEHPAKHPKQKVAATNLVVSADIPEDQKRLAYSFRPSVIYRRRAGDFDSSGYCNHAVEEDKPSEIRFACGVDCEGGGPRSRAGWCAWRSCNRKAISFAALKVQRSQAFVTKLCRNGGHINSIWMDRSGADRVTSPQSFLDRYFRP